MSFKRLKAIKKVGVLHALVTCFLLSFSYATTPLIAKVSVTSFVQGSAVIVMGSHLQDTDLSGLELSQSQSNFEGASFSADGWAEVVDYGNTGALTLDRTTFLTGSQSFCTRLFRCGLETGGAGYRCGAFIRDYPRAYNNQMQNVYVRYYVRYSRSFQWPNNYVKQFYFHGQSAGFVLQPRLGGTGYLSAQPNISYYGFPKPMANERWYCIEGRFGVDGSGEMWLDGKSMGTGGPGPNPGGWYYFEIGMPNASTFATNPDSKIWFEGINLSETRRIRPEALVYLANGSNFSTATKVVQELTYISDTNIRFNVDLTGLGTGPVYLFVLNNRNENSAPYLPTTAIGTKTGRSPAFKEWNVFVKAGKARFILPQNSPSEYQLSVYDLAGKMVFSAKGREPELRIEAIRDGIYLAKLAQGRTESVMRFQVLN